MADSRTLQLVLALRDQFSQGLTNASSRVDQFSDTLEKHRTQLLAVSAALTGIGVFSIKMASDLGEAQNKAAVTFGESAAIIEEFAKTSADAFGISRRSANEYTATLGQILQTSGLSRAATADMSVELVKLAADLASFNNLGIDEALEKLRSGLVGQAIPLRTVGVLLSETEVKAKALELGLGGVSGELTEGEKVQARYALILEQTRNSQGDFARTSDALANSTRRLRAQFEDAASSLGEQMIPTATRVVSALTKLLQVFSDLSPEVKTVIVAAGGLVLGLAALGLALPPIIAGVGILTSQVTLLAGAFAATAAAGWLLGASVKGVANQLLNLADGGNRAVNPIEIVRQQVQFLNGELREFLGLSDAQAGTSQTSAEQLALYEDAAANAGVATTTYIREVKAGLRPALEFRDAIEKSERALGMLDTALKSTGDEAEKAFKKADASLAHFLSSMEGFRFENMLLASSTQETFQRTGASIRSVIAEMEGLDESLQTASAAAGGLGEDFFTSGESVEFFRGAIAKAKDDLEDYREKVVEVQRQIAQGEITGSFGGILNVKDAQGRTSGFLDVEPIPWDVAEAIRKATGSLPPGIPIAPQPGGATTNVNVFVESHGDIDFERRVAQTIARLARGGNIGGLPAFGVS